MSKIKSYLLGLLLVTLSFSLQDFSGGKHNFTLDHPSLEASLTHSLILARGVGSPTFTRATTATVEGYTASDVWGILTVASGEARFSGARRISEGVWSNELSDGTLIPDATLKGYVAENAATNLALYSSVMENAAWVATNVTKSDNDVASPVGTTTGATLTATAANGTVIQDLGAIGSAIKSYGLWIKRKTGTGDIELTVDGGSAWTAVTVTAGWTRVSISDTLADPDIGIRIVTDTDAIYVWNNQCEANVHLTTDIPTVATAVARNADVLSYPSAGNIDSAVGAMYCEFTTEWTAGTISSCRLVDGGTNYNWYIFTNRNMFVYDGANQFGAQGITGSTTLQKAACHWGTSLMNTFLGGTAGTEGTFDNNMNFSAALYIGNRADGARGLNGTIKNLKIWKRKLSANLLEGGTQ